MPYTIEYAENMGGFASIKRLQAAIDATLAHGLPVDARISFRERSGQLILVTRWDQEWCYLGEPFCTNEATRLDEDGNPYCEDHTSADFPPVDPETDTFVTCSHEACEDESDGMLNGLPLCMAHASA